MRDLRALLVPFLRGVWTTAKREAWSNARSWRLVIITVLVALGVLGAAFGLAGFASQGPTLFEENLVWAHPAYPTGNASVRTAAAWVSDAFGNARPGVTLFLGVRDPISGTLDILGETATDAAGRASFPNRTEDFLLVWAQVSGVDLPPSPVDFGPGPTNVTVRLLQFDLARAGTPGDVFLQIADTGGNPVAGARLLVNSTQVESTDGNGFVHRRFDPGRYALALVHGPDVFTTEVTVPDPSATIPAVSGPNALLAVLALFIMGLMAPVFAIAMSYDAVAKERFTGAMDLLLVRPVSRAGIAVGKFLGVWAAVAVPTVGVALAGAATVQGLSGEPVDGGFVAAFLGGSLLLVATYILIMQVFSSLTRTPGTAVLAGFVVWLFFNVLWNLIFFLVALAAGIPGGTEAYFALNNGFALANPGGVYDLVLAGAAPADAVLFFQGTGFGLPRWAGAAAGAVWIAVLLPLATWTFVRRAPL